MSSKLCLIVFGIVVALAIFAAAEEENSLSEDIAYSRLAREAEPGRGRKIKKGGRKNKKGGRKNKKGGRKNKKGGRMQTGRMQTGRAVDAKCVAQLTLAMRRWKDVVTNFQRQSKRITDDQKKGKSKSGKKGEFAPIAQKLVSSGGGNKSALECGGTTTSPGASKITTLAKDLFDCEVKVNMSCNPDNFPKPNTTLVDKCTTSTASFATAADKCMKLSKEESTAVAGCACWTAADMVALTESVNECKVKDDMDKIKAQKKACVKAFGACKTLQDQAVDMLSACAKDTSKMKKKAAALTKNKKAAEDVQKKIAAVKAAAGRRDRVMRAPAKDCAGFIDLIKQVNKLLDDFPSSPLVLTLSKDVVDSAITCIADQIADLEKVEAKLVKRIAKLVEAIAAIQADIETATGATASASEIEAAGNEETATTAAAAGSGAASGGASAGASGAAGASAGASMGASAGASAGASMGASEGASMPASAGASMPASEGASMPASEGASMPASEGASAGASEGASAGATGGATARYKKLFKVNMA